MSTADPFQQALALHQQGRLPEAESAYRRLLQAAPGHFNLLQLLGTVCAQQQRYEEAVDCLQSAIALDPSLSAAHHNLGNALHSLGRHEEAASAYARAFALKPDYPEALAGHGNACKALGRFEEAIASYERALALDPATPGIAINRGNALRSLGRDAEALIAYDNVLRLQPASVETHYNRGNALLALGRDEEALAAFEQALALKPDYPEACNNRGNALLSLQRYDEAQAAYERALAIRPDYVWAWFNRGNALSKQRRFKEGLESFETALRFDSAFAEAWNGVGMVHMALQHKSEALVAYEKALALRPDYVEALHNYGDALMMSRRFAAAVAAYERALARDASNKYVLGAAYDCRHHACNWRDHEAGRQALIAGVAAGQPVCSPFVFVSVCDDPALQRECARIFSDDRYPPAPEPVWRGERYQHPRIRVAYLSADFHSHAVAFKTVEMFELHDRQDFECFAYSFGPEKSGPMRVRLEQAFEHFIDVSDLSDIDIARRMQADRIDIAVDLMGYTKGCRSGVFALRPAPVSMAYIGYPGSLGASWMDYILADAVVIPPGEEAFYSESVVRMPESYQVNDRQYEISSTAPARTALGLPEQGFVFCCFNNNYKITPDHFTVWMRLLAAVEGSVLWLLSDNPEITGNLHHEAQLRGIAPERLVFATRCSLPDHLARLSRADLFLDTLPYNAHATASDTLWAGLPLLTCTGRSFASRVAASLLRALELPELITASMEDYEARALHLARNPEELTALRTKLADLRLRAPLFDTPRFTRHLENAYRHMVARSRQGLPPASFAVSPLPQESVCSTQGGNAVPRLVPVPPLQRPNPEPASPALSAFSAGTALVRSGQYQAGLDLLDQAVQADPAHAASHSNRAAVLLHLRRYPEAAMAAHEATRLQPDFMDGWNNLGSALMKLQRFAEGLAAYECALGLQPDNLAALGNRAAALSRLRRWPEALVAFEVVLSRKPNAVDAWLGSAGVLLELRRREEAVQAYQKALALHPDHPQALYCLGETLLLLWRFAEAADAFERSHALSGRKFALGAARHCRNFICDWRQYDAQQAQLLAGIGAGRPLCYPLAFLAMSDDPAAQLRCASIFAEDQSPVAAAPLWRGKTYGHAKIRVAYLSADFREHATAWLMAELFELHSRDAFEWHACSYGPPEQGPLRARLERAFDHFHEVSALSDYEIARLLREQEIDIAVDLKGFTQYYRMGILAWRPAPVQLSYLGYPGSLGVPYIDYLVADPVLVRPGEEAAYSEQLLRLPDSYQVNDRQREIAAHTPVRSEMGLPEQGFVFCCFNSPYKITPQQFALWMRLLQAVPGSVLWLLGDSPAAETNLRCAAEASNVAAARLIFAPRMALPEHLARHRCADLFLDTLPCNAHTTASDALWAGLPLLTCTGRSFASRVAASLLHAIGLPELVTSTPAEYEALALQLASNQAALAAIKQKLATNRLTHPLFDTVRFARHLEAGYRAIHARSEQGLPPAAIDVSPLPESAIAGSRPVLRSDSSSGLQFLTQNSREPEAPVAPSQVPVQPVPASASQQAFSAGTALVRKGEFQAALALLDEAARLDPGHAATQGNRAATLLHLGQYEAAVVAAREATRLAPDFADGWNNLGSALVKLQRPLEALAAFDNAVRFAPGNASMHNNRGLVLDKLNRPGEAALAYARVRQIEPGYRGIHSSEVFALRKACLWSGSASDLVASSEQDLLARARAGEQVSPFVLMAMSDDPELLWHAACNYSAQRYPPAPQALWQGQRYKHQRIRLAYLSADFHSHATAYLMAELFELHDRSRFELWAFSFGPDKSGPVRKRLEQAFEHFHDVSELSDPEVARLLLAHEIDIAVDLKGYTQDCRPGILGHRPAPVQVNYLGFPGSMGSPTIDYILADATVLPPEHEMFYSEQVVRLPDTYQVNDRQRAIAPTTPDRQAQGLPAKGFVFCCFNNNYKLTPVIFDIWMRLLLAVPGSVLWLLESNAEAAGNLRREAAQRGVDPTRLVFAPKLPLAEHLARHRHADLFLDTLPYNAHTTTSDALWAGLPVLTCRGQTFAGRVAASLLHAIDLPELVTTSLADYEAQALNLATHRQKLSALRRKLARRRLSTPLFDTEGFCRHLEAAYAGMHARARQGLPPAAFAVPAGAKPGLGSD